MAKSNGFCFTLNNYNDEERRYLRQKMVDMGCTYFIMGYETGKKGTPHIQGYVQFPNKRTMSQLLKINKRVHWEMRRGTGKQASDYCKKGGKFREWGELTSQGKRSDLEEIYSLIKEGYTYTKILEECGAAAMKYERVIKSTICDLIKERDPDKDEVYVEWWYGKPGSGKSRRVNKRYPEAYVKDDTKWWDGYEGQDVVIIDDINVHEWSLKRLLSVMDVYKCKVERKGGYVNLGATKIIIISQRHPMKYYVDDREYSQILRRIDKLYKVKYGGIVTLMDEPKMKQRIERNSTDNDEDVMRQLGDN